LLLVLSEKIAAGDADWEIKIMMKGKCKN